MRDLIVDANSSGGDATGLAAAVAGSTPAVRGGAIAALVLLAVTVLLAGGGRTGRIRQLASVAPSLVASPADAGPLRPRWVGVAAVAVGSLGWVVAGPGTAVVVGTAAGVLGAVVVRRTGRRSGPAADAGSDLACCWELLAVCLEVGLPVALAVSAAAEPLDGSAGYRLRRVAGLLELGADPGEAWVGAEEMPALATFARAAGRSAATGAALAQVARAEAEKVRAELVDSAQASAQRAAVLITGPLGLCFLPAFLVLGIAPVVIGLAGKALAQW